MKQWCRWIIGCSAAFASAGLPHAQTSIAAANAQTSRRDISPAALPKPAVTLEAALHEAYLDADIVFTGEVTSIERTSGSVLVHWHVEEGIQHAASGGTYIQREWAGLWSGDSARYRIGQRALVLLRAPSVAGYAAPVADGIVPLRGTQSSSTVDLRWIAQHVTVTDTPRLTPMLALRAAGGSITAAAALLEANARASAQARTPRLTAPESPVDGTPAPTVSQTSTDPLARVDGGMVLDMLHAWRRTSGAAR